MATTLALIFLTATAGGSLTPPQRDVVRRLEAPLLAPCCYSQADFSAEAAQMRQEIEELVASGESETAIVAHYKARYGERILVVPDGKTGKFLFALPMAAVVFCSAIFVALLRRMVKAGTHPASAANQQELDRLREQFADAIERQLRDLA